MATADVLLHPLRLRIVQALLDGSVLTTAALRDALPDVPTASLYRHIATLLDAGVLQIVNERPVRGAVERSYRLHLPSAVVTPDTARTMTRDEHRRAFTAFATMLLADFDRYLARAEIDFPADGVAYSQAALWLTDDELAEMSREIAEAVTSRMANGRAPGRVKRLISTVLMPGR
ncbi:ArsR family transcriptional regulator [Mycobacterium sp. PS03-16]|uniref:helix-turn-helix domain-containing protein n=1 Tax=Mycobacterium sp. PS03-16 TaxID=2559611 RepID=UPI001073A93B|nr:helix-turn-helix domain-containing protein [Mycobacterium sp. PS03-16]TFV58814.1 ArsR family transcriptional regulator [Mycobacterium sp. PS03-16]